MTLLNGTESARSNLDVSVVIPSLNEALNLQQLLPALHEVLRELGLAYEILVVDKASPDGTREITEAASATYVCEEEPGYGAALMRGFREAAAPYIITMDADLSHPAKFIKDLWAARDRADIIIASRYVEGGRADQPLLRYALSWVLNAFFRSGLAVDVRDMTSGFRLYHKRAVGDLPFEFTNFVVLVQILIEALKRGRHFAEIPFHYQPRGQGRSHAQIISFGRDYLRLFYRVWRVRNSIDFPDYDWRAYDGRIPLQRYWQRKRYQIILRFTPKDRYTVDVGCGSSRIMAALPDAIGVDLRHDKLVFLKRTNRPLLQADGCALPFPDNCFECAVCSQVIEHIPEEGGRLLDELTRILKPEGILVIGTPDYGNWQWRVMERLYHLAAPGAYADEHVTHYTFASLTQALAARGYDILEHDYILKGELIIKARKRMVGP